MGRDLHYLRITWTAFCGIACVLLIVLWVRSYWWTDIIVAQQSSQRYVGIGSSNARIMFGTTVDVGVTPWTWFVKPNQEPVKYLPWFEMSSSSISSKNYVPDWLLVIVSASIGAVPWIRQLPRQLSLRTLMIATTLIALLLGLIVWAVR